MRPYTRAESGPSVFQKPDSDCPQRSVSTAMKSSTHCPTMRPTPQRPEVTRLILNAITETLRRFGKARTNPRFSMQSSPRLGSTDKRRGIPLSQSRKQSRLYPNSISPLFGRTTVAIDCTIVITVRYKYFAQTFSTHKPPPVPAPFAKIGHGRKNFSSDLSFRLLRAAMVRRRYRTCCARRF
jgi:hypothetical protein